MHLNPLEGSYGFGGNSTSMLSPGDTQPPAFTTPIIPALRTALPESSLPNTSDRRYLSGILLFVGMDFGDQ